VRQESFTSGYLYLSCNTMSCNLEGINMTNDNKYLIISQSKSEISTKNYAKNECKLSAKLARNLCSIKAFQCSWFKFWPGDTFCVVNISLY